MPYHVVIEGEKRGPYPVFRVIEMLRDGEALPDALGWEPGMESWIKLRELPAFAEVIEEIENPPEIAEGEESSDGKGSDASAAAKKSSPETPPAIPSSGESSGGGSGSAVAISMEDARAKAEVAARTRPFSRFWARFFDYLLVSTVAIFFVEVPPSPFADGATPSFAEMLSYVQQPEYQHVVQVQSLAVVGWHLIEGILLFVFGTTPGKAAFGIRIVNAGGGNPGLGKGLMRAFLVWMLGMGLGLPILSLIAMVAGLFVLLMSGVTLWDRQLGLRVEVAPLTPVRFLIVTGAVFLLLMLTAIAGLKFS